jgi:hypothetical protein
MPRVPVTIDMIQEVKGILTEVPEIRVWCHPHYVGKTGGSYETFNTFQEALAFIKAHPEAEKTPLLAFQGWELNLFAIEPPNHKPAQ